MAENLTTDTLSQGNDYFVLWEESRGGKSDSKSKASGVTACQCLACQPFAVVPQHAQSRPQSLNCHLEYSFIKVQSLAKTYQVVLPKLQKISE